MIGTKLFRLENTHKKSVGSDLTHKNKKYSTRTNCFIEKNREKFEKKEN